MAFDDSIDFRQMNFREHPEQYRVGKGKQGILLVDPYKCFENTKCFKNTSRVCNYLLRKMADCKIRSRLSSTIKGLST